MSETTGRYIIEGSSQVWNWRTTASLIKHLTRRHLAARYRGSALGFLWSLLNPILMMVVYTFVFKFVLRLSAPGVPYPIFFLTGLLAWNFLHIATLNASTSVTDNHNLIHNVYFPRIALPMSAVLSNGFNYLISIPILIVFGLFFGIEPTWSLLLFPLALLHLLALATGLGLLAAGLTPFFRDVVPLLEILFLGWFFATPVLYPMSLAQQNLAPKMFLVYQMNPMAGAVSLIRAAFLGETLVMTTIAFSSVGTLVILAIGLSLFQRLAPRFATAS